MSVRNNPTAPGWKAWKPGQRVEMVDNGWTGTVERVRVAPRGTSSGNSYVRVRWDHSGASGIVAAPAFNLRSLPDAPRV